MLKFSNYNFKQWVTICIIGVMMMMESIDSNIITVAIPAMAQNLGVPPLSLKFAITSYLISLAIFIPISGFLADRFGTKKILVLAILGFGASSMCCGLANSLFQLVLSRFLQGLFGALLVPVGRLLMLKVFDKQDLVKVYMMISMPLLLGPLVAPYLGGLLVSVLSWRFIFYVNLPFAILALLATIKVVDNYTQQVAKFNWYSFIFLALFLASLAYWLDSALDVASWREQLITLSVSFAALLIYLKIEFGSENRIINYNLFKIETYWICFWSSALSRIALGARGFTLVLYLQLALKITPLTSGFLISWMAAGYLFSRIAISKFLKHLGFRRMLTISNVGTSLSMLMFCFIHEPNVYAVLIIILNGFFSAIILLLLNVLCFADVKSEDYASATGLNSTTQQLFFALGVAVGAGCIYVCNKIYTVNFSNYTFFSCFVLIAIIGFLGQIFYNKLKNDSGVNLIRK